MARGPTAARELGDGLFDWMWDTKTAAQMLEAAKYQDGAFREGYAWTHWLYECHYRSGHDYYVYVISQACSPAHTQVPRGLQAVKIGRARNVTKRLGQLQTGNPVPLQVEIAMPVAIPKRAEESAHRSFVGERAAGEWFITSRNTIQGIRLAANELFPGDFNG